jgi:hypothetical protein
MGFLDIYTDIKSGNFDSKHQYLKFSKGENIDGKLLPYLAIYFHHTGHAARFRVLLDEFAAGKMTDFDLALAEGIVAGLDGEAELALRHIRKAWLHIPFLKYYYLPPLYQLAETCEWLYERTNDRKYLDATLTYALRQKEQNPTVPWPYTFLAKYAESDSEKFRALGIALFLDPNAERISHFTEAEKKRAQQGFSGDNVFNRVKEQAKMINL